MGAVAVAMPQFDAWLREAPAPVIDHRRFGALRASYRRESELFLWESLDLVQTGRGLVDLEFEAGAWGPSEAHARQLEVVVARLDALTRAAARAIAERPGDGIELPRSDRQWTNLDWQGARLTGGAGTFQLHYWCNSGSDVLITVSFEQWSPTGVRLHD